MCLFVMGVVACERAVMAVAFSEQTQEKFGTDRKKGNWTV